MSFLNLETETIRQIALSKPLQVDADASIRVVLECMKQAGKGSVLICRAEKLVGIFTERDALRIIAHGYDLSESIGSVMTPNPVAIRESDHLARAIQLMSSGGYRRLPVLDAADVPTGMIKASQIVHYLVEHFPQFVYNLPPAPHHSVQEREGA